MYKILIVDLETESHPWYGKVASPFCPQNYIVAPGWRVDTVNDDGSVTVGDIQWEYFQSKAEADASDWFERALTSDVAVWVAHNAGYEMQWFLSRYRQHLEAFFKRGGRLACTALAQYLISHQTMLYPSLDETAPLYGGTHKVDGVKILWEQGVLTSAIDKDLLLEYLVGPSGDIENTALCFYGQQQRLAEQGMSLMYWERCDALMAFAYCEFFGLHVNTEVAYRNLREQEAEIARLQEELHKLLPADVPDWIEFNWGSDYHMSALVYGGPVKGRRRVPYDPPQYEKADFWKVGDELVPHVEGTPAPEGADRYKSGKNKGHHKLYREDTDVEKLKWAEDSHVLPGLVKFSDLPDNVREKYLDKRAEFRGARLLCDGVTPVYSTATEALEGLANFVPEVKLMVELAALEKDTSTYYLRAEYAKGKHGGATGVSEAVGPGEQGQSEAVRPEEEHASQVRADLGGLASNAGDVQPSLPDMREGSGEQSPGAAGDASSAGPLSRDGQDSGSALPHLQQSAGDGGRQPGRGSAIRALPQVGVDGCTKVKGMLQYVGPDSIVHHNLNVTATVTARLSSSTPNLQNLPRDGTSKVKQMFTSRFGERGRIIEVDYSALEVVMNAALTGDKALLKMLNDGIDMHCYRLAYRLNEPYEDVLLKAVGAPGVPAVKDYKQMRTDIKPVAFAAQYGASAEGIAFNTGCTVEFAQEFLDNEAKLFPDAIGFRQVIRQAVEQAGMADRKSHHDVSGLHREMADSGAWSVYRRGHWQSPGGTCYSFRQQRKWDRESRQEIMDYKDTQLANYWCQGEAGFLMSSSMGRICRALQQRDWFDNRVCLINNVHDAAYLDAADEVVGREAALLTKAIMEDAPHHLTRLWPAYAMDHVPFPAAAEMGVSMYDKEHIH